MGQILDVVPNHMCITGANNGWWLNVLENGPASRFASYFDIDGILLGSTCQGGCCCPYSATTMAQSLRAGDSNLRLTRNRAVQRLLLRAPVPG